MEKRTLGRTGLKISVLGMGGLYVSSAGARGRDEACRAVHRALELGVNYVDTAPNYRDSEEVLGIALEGITQPYFLATKLGGRPQPFNPQDKDLLRQSVDESLRLLKRDYIDVLLVHEPDRPGQYDWWTDYDRFHGPVCDLLEELKAEKIIRFTGLGGTTAYQLPLIMATGNYDVVLTAFNYSLLWREATIAIFPEAERQNMGIIIGSPLQQGALVLCRRDSFTKSLDFREDGIGRSRPYERVRVGVPLGGIAFDALDALSYLAERVPPNRLARDDVEPNLHLVEPRSIGGGVVKVKSGAPRQPLFDLGMLVGGVMVNHEMHVETAGHVVLDVA